MLRQAGVNVARTPIVRSRRIGDGKGIGTLPVMQFRSETDAPENPLIG